MKAVKILFHWFTVLGKLFNSNRLTLPISRNTPPMNCFWIKSCYAATPAICHGETLNIRSVKPNTVLQPGIFKNFNVLNQLRCKFNFSYCVWILKCIQWIWESLPTTVTSQSFQGVLEAIRISCAGYPTKRTFEEFLDRFGMLVPDVLDGYRLF